jgi:hypothetical protein
VGYHFRDELRGIRSNYTMVLEKAVFISKDDVGSFTQKSFMPRFASAY